MKKKIGYLQIICRAIVYNATIIEHVHRELFSTHSRYKIL